MSCSSHLHLIIKLKVQCPKDHGHASGTNTLQGKLVVACDYVYIKLIPLIGDSGLDIKFRKNDLNDDKNV